MSKFRVKLARKGFTLVEIIVVMGILSIVVFLIATYIRNTGRQSFSVAQSNDINGLVNEFQSALNSSAGCFAAITPPPPPNPPTLDLAVPAPGTTTIAQNVTIRIGNTIYGAGNTMRFGALTIRRLQFVSRVPFTAGKDRVSLEVEVDKAVGNEAAGANISVKSFGLLLTLSSDVATPNRVTGCSAMVNEFWVRSAAPSDIVYLQGNVGIGNAADPPQALLHVAGTVQASAYMYNSDAQMKENVREIPSALDRVTKLHGILFDWKDKNQMPQGVDQLGLLAQEVEKVFPEVVKTDLATGRKSVGYGNLIAPLIEALKEQQQIIRKQQREIMEIKKALNKK